MTDEQPTAIKAFRDQGVLGSRVADAARCAANRLSARCGPTAPVPACVDELTGVRTLNVNAIPANIAPARIELCGNYALKVEWNDGHSTGLYTWQRLSEMGSAKRRMTKHE